MSIAAVAVLASALAAGSPSLRVGPEVAFSPADRLAGYTFNIALATDGSSFLAAWRDLRGPARVRVARISVDGEVLDDGGIVVSAPGEWPRAIGVAWTGDAYVVVWASPGRVAARLVTRDGHVLGEAPVAIVSSAAIDTQQIEVASSGRSVLIGYVDGDTARIVMTDVTLRRARPVGDAGIQHSFEPYALASAGGEYLVAGYASNRGGILLQRVGEDGTPRRELVVPAEDVDVIAIGVAAGRYCVAWSADRVIRYTFVSRDLQATKPVEAHTNRRFEPELHVTPRSHASATIFVYGNPAVSIVAYDTHAEPPVAFVDTDRSEGAVARAANGATYALWDRSPDYVTVGSILATDNIPVAIRPLTHHASEQFAQAVKRDTAGTWTAWVEWAVDDPFATRVLARDFAAPLAPPVELGRAIERARPSVASSGSDHVVVWFGSSDLQGVRLANDGRILQRIGPIAALGASLGWEQRPAVIWNGSVYVLAWSAPNGTMVTATLQRDGTMSEPVAIPSVRARNDAPVLVRGRGDTSLLVWQGGVESNVFLNPPFPILAVLLDGQGRPAGSAPVVLAPGGFWPDAVWNGTSFGVTWAVNPYAGDAAVAMVSEGLAVLDQLSISGFPRAAVIGETVYFLWSDGGAIKALQVAPNASLTAAQTLDWTPHGQRVYDPRLAWYGGRPMLTYLRLADEPEYGGVYRLFARPLLQPRVRATR